MTKTKKGYIWVKGHYKVIHRRYSRDKPVLERIWVKGYYRKR